MCIARYNNRIQNKKKLQLTISIFVIFIFKSFKNKIEK